MQGRRRRLITKTLTPGKAASGYKILALGWWLLLSGLIWAIDPEVVKNVGFTGTYLPLPLLTALAVGWTMGLIRHSALKGAFWGAGVGFFMFLRTQSLGEWVNAILIIVFLLVMEWYWRLANGKISLNE